MAVVNLTPLLDTLGGTVTSTAASFRAVAMRAGRSAVRVTAGTVTFPTEITAAWTAAGWDALPQLHTLPADCYWSIRIAAAGTRLEGAYILPTTADEVDFGDLIAVIPETAQPDTSTIAQFQATQQFVANQVTAINATASTIFGTVATVQAQIGTATEAAQTAATEAAGSASTAAGSASAAATSATSAASAAIATAADRAAITAAITDFYATNTTIDGNA
jgi:hypothetical protein